MKPASLFVVALAVLVAGGPLSANVIDGTDDRDSILVLGPRLGLSEAEVARIRKVSGHVVCQRPEPAVASGALFIDNRQILTAAHIFFAGSGARRSDCYFQNQDRAELIPLDLAKARFGARQPKAGSNDDWAVVRLSKPIAGGEPFPVAADVAVRTGDRLIVVTAHPAAMAKKVDPGVPVVQRCLVRRAARSARATSFFRTDCDATGASSGGMNLSRVDGRLVFRGITVSTGPWRDPKFEGAPYDEKAGSVTTALGADRAILEAGRALADE